LKRQEEEGNGASGGCFGVGERGQGFGILCSPGGAGSGVMEEKSRGWGLGKKKKLKGGATFAGGE